MNILMISSEAVPFAKSGGLADVVTSLSYSLIKKDHDVRIFLPLYHNIPKDSISVFPWKIEIALPSGKEVCRIGYKVYDSVPFYFLIHPYFSDRAGIYGETSAQPYPDNLIRFSLFNASVFELCRYLAWTPEIMHIHDWTTCFIPLLLKKQNNKIFKQTKTMLTIHNLGYQGVFSKFEIHDTGLSADEIFSDKRPDFFTQINMLETGIKTVDVITTVSKTYAKEIQMPEFGHGLNELLCEKDAILYGILNGVDYKEWNPQTDSFLPLHYSELALGNKNLLKTILQQENSLEQNESVPLIGMVSRIADQKGFHELCSGQPSTLERILELPIQMVIVGTGDPEIEKFLLQISQKYKNLSVRIEFNDYIAHLVEAGSDFFLMPSRYEPCGLNQIYSLKYGTIPIVRKTGGLADTVEQLNDDLSVGTGLLFEEISGEAIFDSIQYVCKIWNSFNTKIPQVKKRCMTKDFSWSFSAQEYINLYEMLLNSKGDVYA